MNKLALLFAAAVSSVMPAWSADFLEPENPGYLALEEKNTSILKEAFDPAVTLRMIAEPSFRYSSAVFLKQQQGRSFIVTLELPLEVDDTLRRYDEIDRLKKQKDPEAAKANAAEIAALQKNLAPYPKEIKADRCSVEIDAAFADKLTQVWKIMLTDLFPFPDNGFDGTFYHFSMRLDGKVLAGQVWSPGRNTRPGRLVAIGEMMRQYCLGRRENIIGEADKIIGQPKP